MPALKIDLYSDIVCPWCAIGQHRLDKVLSERFPTLEVDVEHHPFELHPTAPPEGYKLADYFVSRGFDIANEGAIFAKPEAEARTSGLELKLSFERQPLIFRTVHAHTLLRHARGRGTQGALAKAFMHAFFVDGRNVSDKDGLADIATKHGFAHAEAAAILADPYEQAESEKRIAASREKGVRTVPTFDIGGLVMGGGSEDQIADAIAQRRAP
ncbi:DsbA family oxidoreductase [Lysobacter sp. K5869]|uniref:DsbA family oxidoreductase n=1 Tax=Lysobacter sp. K5869 TaxID=2820808 RepID=UPI001C0633CD|nr:DsbA family oxidoreductase [Lysobacter sp. K5869]QWP75890.1 DsbA family oxidoreductase [Lysobacter sp. K5869]